MTSASHLYRRQHRWAVFVVVTALLGIVAGANVTSTKSGDAIPTWPWGLFGQSAPEWIELSHRFAVAFPIVGTAILLFLSRGVKDVPLARVAKFALGLVLLQAVIGGVRVLAVSQEWGSPGLVTAFKVVHASVAQVFLCLAAAAAAFSSRWWQDTATRPVDDTGLSILRASLFALVFLFLQVVLGALGRHDVIPREAHGVFALVVLVSVARLVIACTSDAPRDVEILRGPAALLGFLGAVQLVLGIVSYIIAADPATADPAKRGAFHVVALNLHLVAASGMLALTVLLLLRTVRVWGLPTPERVEEAKRLAGASS